MSIENLKKILESERIETSKQYGLDKFPVHNIQTTKDFTQDINFARRMTYSCAFKSGHESATNRLLPLLEKAVENIEKLVHKLESSNRYDESCGVNNWEESEPEKQRYDIHKEATKKAREFLLRLSETTESVSEFTKMVEIKKESV